MYDEEHDEEHAREKHDREEHEKEHDLDDDEHHKKLCMRCRMRPRAGGAWGASS